MEIDYKSIGQRIKTFRLQNGFSQEKLAELADLTPAHVSHIETANTKISLPSLLKIANALGVSLDDLVYENMIHNKHVSVKDLERLLSDCDDKEVYTIVEMVKTTKQIIRRIENK